MPAAGNDNRYRYHGTILPTPPGSVVIAEPEEVYTAIPDVASHEVAILDLDPANCLDMQPDSHGGRLSPRALRSKRPSPVCLALSTMPRPRASCWRSGSRSSGTLSRPLSWDCRGRRVPNPVTGRAASPGDVAGTLRGTGDAR
jgi:hypothetical protein